jgi:23S rRNA pseudouridine1911/1915/1917 synthase
MPAQSFVVSRAESGQTLAALLHRRLGVSWSEARRLVGAGRIRLNSSRCADPNRRLAHGQRVVVLAADPRPARTSESRRRKKSAASDRTPEHAEARPGIDVRFVDDQVAVVDKPPGLTTMRHPDEAAEFGARGRHFLPPTLADLLPEVLARRALGTGSRVARVRAVHRLDKDTSGLVVFALTAEAERHLGKQFRAHTIARRYLALVRGRPREGRIESWLVADRGDGRRGSSEADTGQRAVTHVRVLEELGAFALVECRLETGRTHQVRIHLGEAGAPLCGERVYDRPLHGAPLPDNSGAERVMLHAATLGFEHPVTGERLEWESPLPPDMEALLRRLREQAGSPAG